MTHPAGFYFKKAKRGTTLMEARAQAHIAFDRLWKSGTMTRAAAYQWLASTLNLPTKICHIGWMGEKLCREVVRACNASDIDEIVKQYEQIIHAARVSGARRPVAVRRRPPRIVDADGWGEDGDDFDRAR